MHRAREGALLRSCVMLPPMFQAFQLGPFLILTRLLFILAGVWLSMELFIRLAESANLSLQHFRDHGFWYLISFIFGGRLFAIIAEYRIYLQDPLRSVFLTDGNF